MMRRKHNRRLLKNRLPFLIIFAAALILVIFIFKLPVIRSIEKSPVPDCASGSAQQADFFLGKNLLFLNKAKYEDGIKRKYPCIKGVDLTKSFPDRIKVSLVARKPKVLLVALDLQATSSAAARDLLITDASPGAEINLESFKKKDTFLVDEEGVIFPGNAETQAPKIYSLVDFSLGQRPGDNLIKGIFTIHDNLNGLGININSSLIGPDWSYFVYSKPKVYFNLKGNLDFQLASLQLILKEAKIENINFIDLRFDKPIVKFAPKKDER